jgi:hypothetical protein
MNYIRSTFKQVHLEVFLDNVLQEALSAMCDDDIVLHLAAPTAGNYTISTYCGTPYVLHNAGQRSDP